MNIFLTGATGHIGRSLAEEFLGAGHQVAALVRSTERAAEVINLGAQPVWGDLREPESYRRAAQESDVLVHAAFEYSGNSEVRSTDQMSVDALLRFAHEGGRKRQLIYTSSAYLLAGLGEVDESADAAAAPASSQWRLAVERSVLEAGMDGSIRTAVVRSGLVYGGRGGTMPALFGDSAREGTVAYHGDGQNRWVLVYRRDLAALYLRIIERQASGIFHGVDGTPLRAVEVAEAASRAAGWHGRTRSIPLEGAAHDEHVERALVRDVAVSSRRSRELGWAPSFESFTEGADRAFAEWSGS